MEKVCYIFGAGDYQGILLPEQLKGFIIAADGGFLFLRQNKITPDLLVGDFDSLQLDSEEYLPQKEHIITHKPEKDETDMMLSVKEGFERGYRLFHIYGGTGKRMDHTLANIQTLTYIAIHGGRGYLLGAGVVLTVIHNDELTIPAVWQKGQYISVFCLGDKAEGVDLIRLKYPLEDAVLTKDFPLGTSNEFMGQDALIKVRQGTLLVIWQTV